MASVTVVIPCFNDGKYLREAVESTRSLRDEGIAEVVIVNDGSTDGHTVEIMAQLQRENWRVINQGNLGLAEARNVGIRSTSSEYILPLDSDNIIIPAFVRRALELLKKNAGIDIVYSDCEHFGNSNFFKTVGDFDPCKLINDNYIDACAVYRRSVWQELKGYDGNLPHMGGEDWDFWIGAIMKKRKFHYLPMQGFRYRVRSNSMLHAITDEKGEENRQYIYMKHNFPLMESIRINYGGDSEKFKQKYFRQLESLNTRTIRNIVKLLIGKKFG